MNLKYLQKRQEKFEKEAKVKFPEIEFNKEEYTKVDFPMKFHCPKHGFFSKTPQQFLLMGCSACNSKRYFDPSGKEFVLKAKQLFPQYEYSKVKYLTRHKKVEIICPEHGSFWKSPANLLSGQGCSKCSKVTFLGLEGFLERAKRIHGNKYDYSRVVYKNLNSKVEIVCPKHGSFWQLASSHVYGWGNDKQGCGCPKCARSRGEERIEWWLTKQGLTFETQKVFKDCFFKKFLPFDFYLPDFETCIEFQGEQHYKPIDFSNSKEKSIKKAQESFKSLKERDNIKKEFCKKNNLNLIEVPFNTKNIYAFLKESLEKVEVKGSFKPQLQETKFWSSARAYRLEYCKVKNQLKCFFEGKEMSFALVCYFLTQRKTPSVTLEAKKYLKYPHIKVRYLLEHPEEQEKYCIRTVEKVEQDRKEQQTQEYKEKVKNHQAELKKKRGAQLCFYEGEYLKFSTLTARFNKLQIPHAHKEAKKYIISS